LLASIIDNCQDNGVRPRKVIGMGRLRASAILAISEIPLEADNHAIRVVGTRSVESNRFSCRSSVEAIGVANGGDAPCLFGERRKKSEPYNEKDDATCPLS
jgi:hypothetical protein